MNSVAGNNESNICQLPTFHSLRKTISGGALAEEINQLLEGREERIKQKRSGVLTATVPTVSNMGSVLAS